MSVTDFELQFLNLLDRFDDLFKNFQIGDYTIITWFWWLITQLGGSIIIIGLLILIYWCIDKEKGEKIAFAIISSFCVNGVLKSIISRIRPFDYNNAEYANIRKMTLRLDHASGSSFPSGHSQNGITMYTSFSLHDRSKGVLVLTGIMFVIIPFSRLYLGVHYPSDVIMGAVIGLTIAFFNFVLLKYCYRKKYIFYLGSLIFYLPFLFIDGFAEKDLFKGIGLLIGFIVGILLEEKKVHFTTEVTTKRKLLRLVIGGSILGLIYLGYFFTSNALKTNNFIEIDLFFTLGIHALLSFSAFGLIPLMFKKESGLGWL